MVILFGRPAVWAILRPYEEHLGETILNLGKQFRCRLKIFYTFSSGGNFVWQSWAVWEL